MKKRRVARDVLRKMRHERKMHPFTEETRLRDLINTESQECKDALKELVEKLSPYLKDQGANAYSINKFDFDLESIKGIHLVIITILAEFLCIVKKVHGLIVNQSVFIRYFSDPAHCNLEIPEGSLKALILREMPKEN